MTEKLKADNTVLLISIHTPTKGVTKQKTLLDLCEDISIHTPTKGVTLFWLESLPNKKYFNPHSHEGSDDVCRFPAALNGEISIHTPTKGVTKII